MEDAQIIELYWDRDEEAIRQTDRKYGKYCTSIAYGVLQEWEECRECVSDTWLRTWNSIPPNRPQILRTYVGKITRNLALNRYEQASAQKRGGGQTEAVLDELAEIVGTESDVQQAVDLHNLQAAISAFLRRQTKEERIVFVQRYWYMRPVKEIAKENRISESKAKMMLLRMREKLREHLREEGYSV